MSSRTNKYPMKSMRLSWRWFCLSSWALLYALLAGCATLSPDFDPPKVSVDSVQALPTDGVGPRFEIKLRIINPNTQALDIAGISYGIELLGRELISGVTNEIPRIEGYTEEVVSLQAGINMIEVLRLLTSLGQQKTDAMEYRFTAKIDFAGLVPTQRVEDSGTINLNQR